MNQPGGRDFSPPIVFVRNSYVLGAMFPALEKSGEKLLGVYHVGMVYLSMPDITDKIITHEYSHYLGANEVKAVMVGEMFE